MFSGRSSWVRYNVSKLVQFSKRHRFSTNTTNSSSNNNNGGKINNIRDLEAYRDLDKLDFMKAAKILFTHPPKTKKFGLDFHLVQLFFALMPSLAVYLVAQYARSEMRKMDAVISYIYRSLFFLPLSLMISFSTFCMIAVHKITFPASGNRFQFRGDLLEIHELEVKKKAEEEVKAKEIEAKAAEEKAKGSELLEVKERLEALEETVKEIVVDKNKQTIDEKSKNGTKDLKSHSDNNHAAQERQATLDSEKKQK